MLLLTLLLAGCGGVDSEQAALCRRLIPAFEPAGGGAIAIQGTAQGGPDGRTVTITYRAAVANHWIACTFGGRFFDAERHELTGVATDRTGPLGAVSLTMLRIWAGLPPPDRPPSPEAAPAAAPITPGPPAATALPVLYFLQLAVNAATLACVYGLLALGYTLVFGIIGQINLAMGTLTMLGAMFTAVAASGLAMVGAGSLPVALLAVLALVMATTAGYGWTIECAVFRHFRGVRAHTPLIAAIGLTFVGQEGVRLLHGARDWWPEPVYATTHILAAVPGFALTAVTGQALVVGLTLALYGGLSWILHRTPHGRAHRACADDIAAAALMGLDVDRTVAITFAIGGAYAAAAGYVLALYYGGINFFTGYLIGFKALSAAVIGGIGSVPGAMLGGALLALVEVMWSGYFAIAHKDVVAFGLLTLFLVFRPNGLLGQERTRGD